MVLQRRHIGFRQDVNVGVKSLAAGKKLSYIAHRFSRKRSCI
jgi:hypothetical protein